MAICLLVGICVGKAPHALAQTPDPYASEPKDRRSASLPLAYGVIVDAGYPLFTTSLSDLESGESSDTKKLSFGVNAYFDAWQVGYNAKNYGNLFNVMARSVGRDCYTGLYFEWGTNDEDLILESLGSPGLGTLDRRDTFTFSRTFYGIGMRRVTGFSEKTSFAWIYDVSLGLTSVSTSDTTESTNSNFYFASELGIAARIPISTTALMLGASAHLGMLPDGVSGDPTMLIGIGVRSSLALNLSL